MTKMQKNKIKKIFLKKGKLIFLFNLFFLLAAVIVVGGVYIFFKKSVQKIVVRFDVTDENPLYAYTSPKNQYATSFQVGDISFNELGEKDAEIVGLETYSVEPTKMVTRLDIKLKAEYSFRKKQYLYKGKPIVYGESHSFVFSKVKVKASVIDFPGFRNENSRVTYFRRVKAQLRYERREFSDTYGVADFIAESVKNGDAVYNKQGDVLAKIVSVDIKPAQRTIVSGNRLVEVLDPMLKDVFYDIDLQVTNIDGNEYMFNYGPVKVGETIPLNFQEINVWPTIIEMGDRIDS